VVKADRGARHRRGARGGEKKQSIYCLFGGGSLVKKKCAGGRDSPRIVSKTNGKRGVSGGGPGNEHIGWT